MRSFDINPDGQCFGQKFTQPKYRQFLGDFLGDFFGQITILLEIALDDKYFGLFFGCFELAGVLNLRALVFRLKKVTTACSCNKQMSHTLDHSEK